MTNDQGAKSQLNPNDRVPNPNARGNLVRTTTFWNLVIGAWDLIGIWLLGRWDFRSDFANVSSATDHRCPQL